MVSSVEPGSPAFRRGLRPGDVILEVNRHSVQSRQGLLEILRMSKPDTDLLLLVRRGKNTHFLVVPSVKG